MPTNSPQVPSLSFAAGLGGFVAAVAAAAAVGIVLAIPPITGSAAGHAVHAPARFTVAQDIPTSFGFVAVEHAETVKGLTAKQMAGAVHGVGGFVGSDKALVSASITLRNGPERRAAVLARPVHARRHRQERKTRRSPVTSATVRDGTLQPDAAVDATLGFVVPRNGASFALEFTDPGRTRPIVIDLKAGVGRATAADKAAAHHGH